MNVRTKPITSDRIQDALYGFTRSQILFCGIDLAIFTRIANGQNTLEKLLADFESDGEDLQERGLRLLLDGLVGVGFLQKSDSVTFTLPPDAAEFLVEETPHYIGGMVEHCKQLYENWALLKDAVYAGQPVGGAQSLVQLETYFSELVKGLYVSNYPTAKKLAKALGLGKERKGLEILDVAGGSGVWSIALLEADKSATATLLDFPTVTTVAEEFVGQHQLLDRYAFWPQDLETFEFPQNCFDLAVLGNICHALGPFATESLIRQMGRCLRPGGELVIVDFVPDDHRSKAGWPLIFAVNMLISTPEGDVFTAAQYKDWMHQAGFTHFEVIEIESEVTAVIGKK